MFAKKPIYFTNPKGISKKISYPIANPLKKFFKRGDDEDFDGDDEAPKIDISKIFGMGGGSASGITRNHNHIYFYTDVSTESCLELNRELVHLTKELKRHSLEFDCEPAKIYLHINSYGGELLACFSTLDYIKNSPIPVVTIIEGCAASAATLISVVAKERYMTPSSWMLIHQLRGGCWGKYEDMEEDLGNSKKFMEKIYSVYEEHTKLDKKQLKKMLKRDEWWNYKTCLEYGLVDGLYNDWKPNNEKAVKVVVEEKKKKKKDEPKKKGDTKKKDDSKKKGDTKKKDKKQKKDTKKSSIKDGGIKKDKTKKDKKHHNGVLTRKQSKELGIII